MAPTVDRSQRYQNKSNRRNEEDAHDWSSYLRPTSYPSQLEGTETATLLYQIVLSFPGSLESGPTSNQLNQPIEYYTRQSQLTIVLHGAKASWKVEMVSGPTSSPIQSSGMLSTATVSDSASGANCAQKKSTKEGRRA